MGKVDWKIVHLSEKLYSFFDYTYLDLWELLWIKSCILEREFIQKFMYTYECDVRITRTLD